MNPFGDDDEDFETSDILDYNLDVSHRSVLMEEETFPANLKAATFEPHPMKGVDDDNLGDFVDSVNKEVKNFEKTAEFNE